MPTQPALSVTAQAPTVAQLAKAQAVAKTRAHAETHAVADRADIDAPRMRLIIDPGHGGSDPGSIAPNGLREKDLTLDVARRVMQFLAEVPDIEVLTTRIDDSGMSRQQRVHRIRDSGADLMLSLHFNHLPQSHVNLVETHFASRHNVLDSFRQKNINNVTGEDLADASTNTQSLLHTGRRSMPDLGFTEKSAAFAEIVQRQVHKEVRRDDIKVGDAGIKENTLFVLTRSFTAGALVEIACISQPEQAERLVEVDYRNRLAAAIADAVRQYRDQYFLETQQYQAI